MGLDKKEGFQDTQSKPVSSRSQLAEPTLKDTLGNLSALVLDLEALSFEVVLGRLAGSREDSIFVVWSPLQYAPAQAEQFRKELVERGATLLERATPEETMEECWARFKERFLLRRDKRLRATGAKPLMELETAKNLKAMITRDSMAQANSAAKQAG